MGHSADNDAVLALLNSLLIAGQADPTAYMDTYCNGSFAGSRAARDDELADQRIQGLPSSPQNMAYQGLYAFFACELRFRCLDPSADVYHLAWNKSVSFTSQTWQIQQATSPGAIVCVNPPLLAACNASASPVNGDKGSCDSSLASGTACLPTCNSGYTVSGVSSCNAGTLTAASCAPNRECHVAMGLNCVNH